MGPQHEQAPLSAREERVVHELEARVAMDDPAMAERFSGRPTRLRRMPSLAHRHAIVGIGLGAIVMVGTFTFSLALAFAGALLVIAATLAGIGRLDRTSG